MTSQELYNILDDLDDEELSTFKFFLQKPNNVQGLPAIPKRELRTADRRNTVDVMVETYGLQGAVQVTRVVLEKISRNDLLQMLPASSPGPEVHVSDVGETSENREPSSSQTQPPLPQTEESRSALRRSKRKSREPSKGQQPKKSCDLEALPIREEFIRSDVKKTMESVLKKLPYQGNIKLNDFLRAKINDLKIDKRELIGVFGRTGAGKSSLINAIIGEKNLLPTGSVRACTSVMIKVESNPNNVKYEADIEFITKKEWEDEVWSMKQFLGNAADQQQNKDDDDYNEIVEKLTALYGKEWEKKFPEKPVDPKYFGEVKEFLQTKKKTLACESAKELSEKLIKYTRTKQTKQKQGQEILRWFWPVVKCVIIKVPNNDLLQHVTLVDLPGSGDRNKSRDEMWKRIVRDCSTVWIVANIDRAAAEKEHWEILKSTCSLIGHGGQCQRIHFVCTKSDVIEDPDDDSKSVRDCIVERNVEVKEEVQQEFDKLSRVKKHFSVSAKESLRKLHLDPEDTEIPELQRFLKDLNDCHSETFNYVSGAYGILSLMQGAKSKEGAEKKTYVCAELEKNLKHQLGRVQEAVEDAHKAFETCLTEGVENSKSSCEETINSFLYPPKTGRGFHRTLKSVVLKHGVHKTKEGRQINLNVMLASWLTDSIDEEFRKTFPNEDKSQSFKGAIRLFSLDTLKLIEKNQSLNLQLIFLMTEEQIIKIKLNDIIQDYKKTIYSSLAETIKENMLECYKGAAAFSGTDTLENMRDTVEQHVRDSKTTMFEEAKAVMLKKITDLKGVILKILQETLEKSIEISLKTDDNLTPDVAKDLEKVKEYYDELQRSRDGETSQLE